MFSQIQNGRVILYINRPFVEEGHPAAAQIATTTPVVAQHQLQHPATATATSQPVIQQATQHLQQQQQLNVERSVLSQQFSGSDDSIGYK